MARSMISWILMAPPRWAVGALMKALPESVGQNAYFELRSTISRRLTRPLAVDPKAKNYVNLGSGHDDFPGFIAIDFFGATSGYGADLRYPLRIDSDVLDGIFTEHTLEHLSYDEVARLLVECCRTLKPGGRIRVVLPDVSLFVKNFAQGNAQWFKAWEEHVLKPRGRTMASPMVAISFITQEYGHRSAWDSETLGIFLSKAGFVDIRSVRFREGADPMLLKDNASPDRVFESFYVEAVKPLPGGQNRD